MSGLGLPPPFFVQIEQEFMSFDKALKGNQHLPIAALALDLESDAAQGCEPSAAFTTDLDAINDFSACFLRHDMYGLHGGCPAIDDIENNYQYH